MASKSAAPKSTASAKPLLAKVLVFGFLIFIASVLWFSLFSKTPPNTSKNIFTQKSEEKNSTKTSVLNSNEEEAWIVFKNEKYGYQIKYPKDWYVKTYPEIPNRTLFDSNPLPESQVADSEPVSGEIEVFVSDEKNFQEEIDMLKVTHQFEGYQQTQVEVDGVSATRIEGKATGESYIKGNYYVRVFVNKNSQSYSLIYTAADKKNLSLVFHSQRKGA